MLPGHLAARLQRLEAEVARLRTGGAPLAGDLVPGDRGQALDARPLDIWARITARVAGNAYAFQRVRDDDFAYPDLTGPFGTAGDGTSLVAREVNGRADVPVGTKVLLAPNRFGAGYTFEYAAGAGTSFSARLTAVSGGLWKFVPLTLDALGVEADDGVETADYCASPLSSTGSTDPVPAAGDRVRMFPSDQAGFYEFIALETFGASGTGHRRGLVPDPGSKAGTTRFLREDGWNALPALDTTPTDKTQIDRVVSASIAVDKAAVVTLSAPKKKANHPYTADGIMVVSITEESPVDSDTSISFEDTTSAFWVSDNVTGEIRVHVKMPADPLAADYTLVDADDRGRLLTFSGARTITCPDPVPDFPDGWFVDIESRDATCTLVRETAATIDGQTSLTIPAGQGVRLVSDGTQWWTQRGLFRPVGALSVVGRSSNTAGDAEDLAAGTDDYVLRRSGTALAFGQVATGGIADTAVTYPKIRDTSAASVLIGRGSKAGAGTVEEITVASPYLGFGKGTVLTHTPDLTPDDSDTVTVVTGVTLAPVGGKLRLAVTSRDLEFVYAAGGEQIATVIGKASTVNTDIDLCLPSKCCEAGDPTASASADPTSGAAPLSVDFTGGASGGVSPYTYSWSFPGGTPSSSADQSPTGVTYSTPGSYTATLTVTDACGRTDDATAGVTVSAAESNDISGCCPDCLFGDTATVSFTTSTGPHSIDLPWYPGASPPGWLDVAVPVYMGTADLRLVCSEAEIKFYNGLSDVVVAASGSCASGTWTFTMPDGAAFAELFDGPGATLIGDVTVTVAASCA